MFERYLFFIQANYCWCDISAVLSEDLMTMLLPTRIWRTPCSLTTRRITNHSPLIPSLPKVMTPYKHKHQMKDTYSGVVMLHGRCVFLPSIKYKLFYLQVRLPFRCSTLNIYIFLGGFMYHIYALQIFFFY